MHASSELRWYVLAANAQPVVNACACRQHRNNKPSNQLLGRLLGASQTNTHQWL
jgi:hypothetical protein